MQENLNKENFWNDLKAQYPEAVEHFCQWIDKYKKQVDWDVLFCNAKRWGERIKFHDIPIEFQVGILLRYKRDILDAYRDPNILCSERQQAEIVSTTMLFRDLQKQLKNPV
jgi:hypothetical protein